MTQIFADEKQIRIANRPNLRKKQRIQSTTDDTDSTDAASGRTLIREIREIRGPKFGSDQRPPLSPFPYVQHHRSNRGFLT
jgi:hypothetical protein